MLGICPAQWSPIIRRSLVLGAMYMLRGKIEETDGETFTSIILGMEEEAGDLQIFVSILEIKPVHMNHTT
jgi:hypothetical protein